MVTPVRKLRLEVDKSASISEFARKHGLAESSFRSADNGTRTITKVSAKQFAKLFSRLLKRPIDWLYLNGEQSDEHVGQRQSPLAGWAGGGDEIMPFETDPDLGPIFSPPGLQRPTAVVIHGSSMTPVFNNNDEIYFDLADEGAALPFGRDCMVMTKDGRRLIKNLRRSKKRGFVRLYSYETNEESDDVQIEWAAPVRWVKRA